ncbi:TOBE domain-containing protein [Haloferula sargassicola]|uniref:Mop domain-containing protein n=1 Tax=Haloferula sargassicola TaxID=490096 RepID=A0ABP9UJN7_9BACT
MPNSIRNELSGTVKSVKIGDIVSEVVIETPAGDVAAIVSSDSVKDLALSPGDKACALVKATNVSVCRCTCGGH